MCVLTEREFFAQAGRARVNQADSEPSAPLNILKLFGFFGLSARTGVKRKKPQLG
jgi:hypothetical protein